MSSITIPNQVFCCRKKNDLIFKFVFIHHLHHRQGVKQGQFYVDQSWFEYFWERYEPPNPTSYGSNSTTTVLLQGELMH